MRALACLSMLFGCADRPIDPGPRDPATWIACREGQGCELAYNGCSLDGHVCRCLSDGRLHC